MPAAVAVPAIVAAVGGTVSAIMGNKAAKAQAKSAQDAINAEKEGQQSAQAFQQKQFDQSRTDREPWRVAGGNALTQLSSRTAPGGDLMRQFGMSDFQKDPGYEFRMAEGMKGMNNSAAARGNLLSGAALKAASRYNQDFASNEFGNSYNRFQTNQTNQFNRLASLADVGQVAANQNASGAMQLGGNVGNALMSTAQSAGRNMVGAGDARASGYLAQGNNFANTLNQGVSAWNQYQNNSRPDNTYMSSNAQNVTPGSSGTWKG